MASLLTTVLVVLVVLVVGVRWLEPRMIYFPGPAPVLTPARLGLSFREVAVPTADGETLRAWWLPAPEREGPVLLFLHGNAGTREDRLDNLAGLRRAGLSVLIVDYRGYGGSSGSPSEAGLIRDGEAAFDWLAREGGGRPIVLFGRSLGGAVAAQLALRRPAAGLILESTFTSAAAMARRVLPIPGVGWLIRTRLDTLAAVRRLELPLLIVHGEADELVPFAMGRALFGAAASPRKVFRAVPGGGHNDTYLVAGNDYWGWIAGFAREAGGER